MTFDSAYPTLQLLIEKTERLEKSGFIASITKEFRLGFNIQAGKPMVITSIRPEQELIDAFVLTFRFFIQKNESISIRSLAKVFDADFIAKEEKEKFNLLRTDLNSFLEESANIEYKNDKLTNKDIMHTIVYGELAHANNDKKKRYDWWMEGSELLVELIWHQFSEIIIYFLRTVQSIRNMFEVIIKRQKIIPLRSNSSSLINVQNYGVVKMYCSFSMK